MNMRILTPAGVGSTTSACNTTIMIRPIPKLIGVATLGTVMTAAQPGCRKRCGSRVWNADGGVPLQDPLRQDPEAADPLPVSLEPACRNPRMPITPDEMFCVISLGHDRWLSQELSTLPVEIH
jgi:hypothetical protein